MRMKAMATEKGMQKIRVEGSASPYRRGVGVKRRKEESGGVQWDEGWCPMREDKQPTTATAICSSRVRQQLPK